MMARLRSLGVALGLAAVAAVAAAADLVKYDSPALPTSRLGVVFSISHPGDWTIAWGGERTRFFPAEQNPPVEGPMSALTYIHVDAVSREDAGADALLNEKKGLEGWITVTRPRYEVEDRRRVKVGPKAEPREAVLTKDPTNGYLPDRRELFVLVPAGDVNFVLRFSAPLGEFAGRDALWRQVLASFEPGGG